MRAVFIQVEENVCYIGDVHVQHTGCAMTIEIGYIEGKRVIKINFGFWYRFTNSLPHLSRTDSVVGKPKITTVQIFTAA